MSNITGKQVSLKTKDAQAAELLLTAMNEGNRDAQVSREVGLAYLFAGRRARATRTLL